MAPMVSLERCMVRLHLHYLKADRPRFGPFGAQAMSDRLLGVLRHQLFQVGLGAFMLHKSRPRATEHGCELCPELLEALISTIRTPPPAAAAAARPRTAGAPPRSS